MIRSLFLKIAFLFLIADTARADGNVVAGEKVFQKCVSCHSGATNNHRQGPSLIGVVGRPVAGVQGYEYSEGLTAFGAAGEIWDEATLDKFLQDTNGFIKGMKMAITPIRREADRTNLIAFLKSKK